MKRLGWTLALASALALGCSSGGGSTEPADLELEELLGEYVGIASTTDGNQTFAIGLDLDAIVRTLGEPGNEAFGGYSTSGGSNGDVRIKRLGGGRYRIRLFQAQPCSAIFVGTFLLVTPNAMDGEFTGSSPCNRGTIFDFEASR